MKKNLVLLVDDNETHRYALGRHLEESGFAVLTAHTGLQAVDLATSQKPNAILLDINLPDITGFDVCERLKLGPSTTDIPVIFHSATHDTQAARDRVIDLGAVSFLSYPINIEHLVSVLQGAIARSNRPSTS
jgi:CheY-like chemotaxis protein